MEMEVVMAELMKNEERGCAERMAKEFLEERLGIQATEKNVHCFMVHVAQFEKEVEDNIVFMHNR